IGMAISSPVDKRWLQVNDRLCDILGYPREELLRLPWTDITHPDDLARNVALFNDLVAGRLPAYTLQKRFIRKDGAAVYTEINVRPLRQDDGSVRHLFTTVQDITERLGAEARLLSNQERLERAEAMAQLGSWSFDPDSGQLWWSAQMYRNFGLTPARAAPSAAAFLARVHPDDKARVEADMRAMSRGESVSDIEFRRTSRR
ncbi:MAG: PAS domain-containing protein, partial [Hydrogenophaga sp.]|nr:PAS domain-containing protein [Hydrogenophaga sp.]